MRSRYPTRAARCQPRTAGRWTYCQLALSNSWQIRRHRSGRAGKQARSSGRKKRPQAHPSVKFPGGRGRPAPQFHPHVRFPGKRSLPAIVAFSLARAWRPASYASIFSSPWSLTAACACTDRAAPIPRRRGTPSSRDPTAPPAPRPDSRLCAALPRPHPAQSTGRVCGHPGRGPPLHRHSPSAKSTGRVRCRPGRDLPTHPR